LFVAPDGNDSVVYDDNSITEPWRTVNKAWSDARDGDVVKYRTGTYQIVSPINVSDGGHNVTHTNYNDEVVNWTSTLAVSTIEVGEPNITIDGINISSAASGGDAGFFRLGWNTNGSSPAGFTLKNCVAQSSGAGGNTGIVHARHTGGEFAEGAVIENCRLIGPGGEVGSINASGIIMFQAEDWVIRNCEISGFNTGIFFNKHANDKSSRGSEIRNNYVHDCHAALRTQGNYVAIENNIFNGSVRLGYDGGPNQSGDVGSDYNSFLHNTIVGSIELEDHTRGGDDLPGAQHNSLLNNIFVSRVGIFPYGDGSHHTTGDYNLYPSGNAVLNNRINYSVSQWSNSNTSDIHSLSGTPVFVGGNSPDSIDGFGLAAGSIGKGSSSEGRDIGANVSLVGVNRANDSTRVTPEPPQNLRTQ
jgi:hypothetical protein